jgi:hypothetical protein
MLLIAEMYSMFMTRLDEHRTKLIRISMIKRQEHVLINCFDV